MIFQIVFCHTQGHDKPHNSINQGFQVDGYDKCDCQQSGQHGRHWPSKQIFGKYIGSFKGKTTRKKPNQIANNFIEIPTKLTMNNKKQFYLSTVSRLMVLNFYHCFQKYMLPNAVCHIGAFMTLEKGIIISKSNQQKINAQSSTKSEMIAVNYTISKVLWTKKSSKLKVMELRPILFSRQQKCSKVGNQW